jgi:hypothetical protein
MHPQRLGRCLGSIVKWIDVRAAHGDHMCGDHVQSDAIHSRDVTNERLCIAGKAEPAMHIHTVFFWLVENIDDNQRKHFEDGLDQLTRDPNVLDRRIGKPAATDRPVIDSSYDYGVILRFENLASHDKYQTGPDHQAFLDNCAHLWSRVQVYDIEEI